MKDAGNQVSALLISMLLLSSISPILSCGTPAGKGSQNGGGPIISIPPLLGKPLPLIGGGGGGAAAGPTPCGAGGQPASCSLDTLKLGACVDLLGGLVHIGLGDPAVNQCCPVLKGVLELEAALCLCTTIKLKLLNLNIYLPLALQLLATCGMTPPPGFTCTL